MNLPQVFVHNRAGRATHYWQEPDLCAHCAKKPGTAGLLVLLWSRGRDAQYLSFCQRCTDDGHVRRHVRMHNPDVPEWFRFIVGRPPTSAHLRVFEPPALGYGRIDGPTVWDIDKMPVSEEGDDTSQLVAFRRDAYTLGGPDQVRIGKSESEVRNPDEEDPLLALTGEPIIPKQLEDRS